MKPSLQLTLGHQLTMTPQLQQAIRLLQLSSVDLQTEIQVALDTNSMLELSETSTPESSTVVEIEEESEELSDESAMPWETQDRSHSSQSNSIETRNGTQTSLKDHLLWQMDLTPFSETDRIIATTLIDAINEDGFLTCSLQEILSTVKPEVDIDEAEAEAVLHRIQLFDPLGVGARNLRECLLIQLAHLPSFTPWLSQAHDLVSYHLELLGKHDYATLRRRLGLSLEELREVVQCIQSLNPRPGTALSIREPEYIRPDLFTYKKTGKWHVKLNQECIPHLQINQNYASLIRRKDISSDNQFLRNQLQEARWFLKSLENRNETLLKVAEAIVSQQQGFLDYGEEAMKPLVLQDVATALDLHESTISRVTTQKYLYTPRGTFELKYFFSSHLFTEGGGECSATAIRALLKKLIAAENAEKPLSDCKLAKLLEKQGIKVARRTVAKYREAMIIPPSNERKQLL